MIYRQRERDRKRERQQEQKDVGRDKWQGRDMGGCWSESECVQASMCVCARVCDQSRLEYHRVLAEVCGTSSERLAGCTGPGRLVPPVEPHWLGSGTSKWPATTLDPHREGREAQDLDYWTAAGPSAVISSWIQNDQEKHKHFKVLIHSAMTIVSGNTHLLWVNQIHFRIDWGYTHTHTHKHTNTQTHMHDHVHTVLANQHVSNEGLAFI